MENNGMLLCLLLDNSEFETKQQENVVLSDVGSDGSESVLPWEQEGCLNFVEWLPFIFAIATGAVYLFCTNSVWSLSSRKVSCLTVE